MKVSTEPLEHCETLLTIEVDDKQLDRMMKDAARRISQQIQVPGFRPGKAPYRMVERRVGKEAIQQEALEGLSDSFFIEAIKEAEIEPYGPPSVEEVGWDPLTIKMRVPTEPVVELGNYRDVRVEYPEIEIGEEEIEARLAEIQDDFANFNPVDRAAEVGDSISFVVFRESVDGEVIAEAEDQELELVEEGEQSADTHLVPHLVGLKAGDEKSFQCTYPEDYDDEELAGKDVTVYVEVDEVGEKELYPLDDDFAAMVGDFENMDALKESTRQKLFEEKKTKADEEYAEKVLEAIIEQAERIEWPAAMAESRVNSIIKNLEDAYRESGTEMSLHMKARGSSMEQLKSTIRPGVEKDIRRRLVLYEVSEAESISVDESELMERVGHLQEYAKLRGTPISTEQIFATGGADRITEDILEEQVLDRLILIGRGEAPELEAEEPEEAAEEPEGEPAEQAEQKEE